MITRIARFKVRQDQLTTCVEAIQQFVTAVAEGEPHTLRYESFQVGGTTSFLHFMQFEDADAEIFHRGTAHVRAFVEVLYPRCEQKPEFDVLYPL